MKVVGLSAPHRQSKSRFFYEIGHIWTAVVVNLVVLACVLKATIKKVVNFLSEEKCTPREIMAMPIATSKFVLRLRG